MADIIIKKKITLEFLGEDYKESYLVFKAVPIDEYEDITSTSPKDTSAAIKLIKKVLSDKFIEGRFNEQDVAKEDIGKFDAETVQECFAILTGQKTNPKV